MLSDSRPERDARGRGHIPPDWVDTNATYFITINCKQRGKAQLTADDMPQKIFDSVQFYHDSHRWWPEIFLLMPDHLHALISFSWDQKKGINTVLSSWKRFIARKYGIEWQIDYFDHRIRNESDHEDKWDYIRQNPVRKGLVESYNLWPHVWKPDGIGW